MKKEVEQKIHEFAEHIYTLGYYCGCGEGLEELLNSTHLNDLQYSYDEGYEKGLNDAWEYIKKLEEIPSQVIMDIFHFSSIYKIARNYTATEITEKIKEYEEKQKQTKEWDSETMYGQFYEDDEGIKTQMQTDDEIKVGDEVLTYNGIIGIVVQIHDCDTVSALFRLQRNNDIQIDYWYIPKLKKTGRNFPQIAEVLKQMEGEND